MKMKIDFIQTENKDSTTCIIKYGDETYTGNARCHPDDMDMANTLTGQEIAYKRALVKMLKTEIQATKTELKIFTNFYNSLKQSKKFNDKCYAAYKLRKEIEDLKYTIEQLTKTLNALKTSIQIYINKKEELYKLIRKNRGQEKKNK